MKKINLLICTIFVMLLFVACASKETERVSQEDTQTTNIISGSAIDIVTSKDIKQEKYLPLECQKRDDDYEKRLHSGKYTWKNPYIEINPYGNSPLTAYVLFETKESCGVKVIVKGETKETDVSGTLEVTKFHRVPVVGLYPGKENEVEICCLDESGEVKESQTIRIKTDDLPKKLENAVKVEKNNGKSAYGLTMISGQTTKFPFAYDENGDIRWYITMTTGSYGVFPLSNQRLIYQTNEALTPTEEKPHTTQMYEMDYLGRAYQVYYVKNGVHHEVIEKTPGGNLMILTSSIDGHTEDVVQEIDRESGEIINSLDMRDVFDETYENKVDWVHLNTVSYNEEDDTVLLCPRNLHSGVKIGWTDKKIRWILTNPKMFEGTEQENQVLKPEGNFTWHFQPHSIYEIPYDLDEDSDTRHIMVYDNHWQTKRKVDFFDNKEQSYVTVYVVNEKEMTVRQEKLFPGVRSIITSNCAYDREKNRMFSFGGYLHPFVDGQKGMIYEFDYKTGETIKQYSTKYYFYRGYEMQIDWDDMAQSLEIGNNYVKGTLQAPIKAENQERPLKKLQTKEIAFYLVESVLYMNTLDHAVSKVRFESTENCYVMDYSSAGKGMKSKKNQKYAIAIPLSGLAEGNYQVVVNYQGEWYDTGKQVVRK